MAKTLNITEARGKLTLLPDELCRTRETIAVTRHGKPVLAIMDWDLYETLVETLEVMGDPSLMADLRQGLEELRTGRVHDWADVKRGMSL